MAVKQASVRLGEPTWEIAHLFPPQGEWSEEEYLSLPTNHLVEFVDGCLEVLPMPTSSHQLILLFLYRALLAFVESQALGTVLVSAIPVRIRGRKYREPDVVFMSAKHAHRIHEQYLETPDLVMEVVSPGSRNHDRIIKRKEYAQAGISEYWIVEPDREQIVVLKLRQKRYVTYGVFRSGDVARSALLRGFAVAVEDVWAASKR